MGLFQLPDLCGVLSRRFSSDVKQVDPQAERVCTSSTESWRREWKGLAEVDGSFASKRVVVVVDDSSEAKMALLWTLSHVVGKLDLVILLHVLPPSPRGLGHSEVKIWDWRTPEVTSQRGFSKRRQWLSSLSTLCSAHLPEAQMQVLVVEGQKGPTIIGQVKKLDASVVVIGQRRSSLIWRLLGRSFDKLAEYCIHNSGCLTIAVRKKSRGLGGYLIKTKWQKNFWLLA